MADRVTITDAKQVCEKRGQRAVLVIAFDGKGSFSTVSYGETKAECAALATVNERIHKLIVGGVIEVPEILSAR